MGCLQDPANVQQTSNKCIQNTRANTGRLLDRVNALLTKTYCTAKANTYTVYNRQSRD